MGYGMGMGAALYDAYRRKPIAPADVNAGLGYEGDAALDSYDPQRTPGTIEAMARSLPATAPAAPPSQPAQPRDFESYMSAPGAPPATSPPAARFQAPGEQLGRDAGPATEYAPATNVARSAGRAPLTPLRTQSRYYAQAEDENKRLGTKDEYIKAHEPHGVLGRIGAGLKLGGRMLLASGLNPLYAAEGLVIGMADKNSNAREQYTDYEEPQSVRRQSHLMTMAGHDLGMQDRQADNARADEQLDMTREQHQATQTRNAAIDAENAATAPYRRKLLTAQTEEAQGKAYHEMHPIAPRVPAVMRQLAGTNEWVDFSNPAKPIHTGEFGPTPPGGETETSVTTEEVHGRPGHPGETDAQFRAREQEYMSNIDSQVARGSMMPKDGEELKNKWREDNKPQKVGEQKTTRKLTPRRAAAPATRQPGQVVTYQGKRHKILSVDPDGTLHLDPTPAP